VRPEKPKLRLQTSFPTEDPVSRSGTPSPDTPPSPSSAQFSPFDPFGAFGRPVSTVPSTALTVPDEHEKPHPPVHEMDRISEEEAHSADQPLFVVC
jgi:hypothetical protein